MIISVCISTFKRPQYLSILLKGINEQELPDNCKLKIIVVDNDPGGSSKSVVDEALSSFVHELVYDIESRRGIPFSRNKAFSLANPNSEFVIFVDDDEYPEKDWIKQLLAMQQQTNADLVEGIVFPELNPNTPSWVIKGNFFLLPHYNALSNGQELPFDAVMTNNLLVKYELLKKLDGPFNEEMGLIGCDDSALGINLHKIGCKMVFTNTAIVHEHIPEERTTFKWIMQRGYRTANTIWLLNPDKNFFGMIKLFVIGLLRVILGIILLIPVYIISLFAGMRYFYKVIRIIVRGVGIMAGIMGFHYEEYNASYTFNKTTAAEANV